MIDACPRRGAAVPAGRRCRMAAAVVVLLSPAVARAAGGVAVVPILIGPLQVLLTLLPAVMMAVMMAVGGMVLAMFKPAFLKAVVRGLWKKKLPVLLMVAGIAGSAYLLGRCWPEGDSTAIGRAEEGAVEWPAYRGGVERRGAAPGAVGPAQRDVVWSFTDGKVATFYSSPAVMGNRVFISSADKRVFTDRGAILCLDADTGGVVWKYSPGDFRATYSSPSVTKKYVVCGEGLHFTKDARITCLDADTGEKVWEYRTKSHVESSAAIADGKVYIGAGDDGMYCIALAPGPGGKPNVVWHLPGEKYPDCETSPAVHDGKVYFGLGEGGQAIVCVNAETGDEIWRTPAPYPVFGSPVIVDGKVLVGMGNGNMIDSAEVVRDRKILKMKEAGKSQAEMDEAAKALGPAGEVWALNAADGKVLWTRRLKRTILGSIAAADGRLYFGSRDGRFHCLTIDGKQIGKPVNVGDAIVTSPAVSAERVYFVTESGLLYCLNRRTLRREWSMSAGTAGPFLSSPAVARGHVYVGTSADGLMCLGYPADEQREARWAGRLGGPGQAGWADGSPLPAQGGFGWRYPKGSTSGTPVETAVHTPVASAGGAIYTAVASLGRTGLAKLVYEEPDPKRTRRRKPKPKEAWFYPTANAVVASVVVRGSLVYFVDGGAGDKGRKLHCVNAGGQVAWTRPVADAATGEIVLNGQRLLAFEGADTLTCMSLPPIDAESMPKVEWSQVVRGPVGMPAEGYGQVLAAGADGVTAMRLADGKVLWRSKVSATTGPVISGSLAAVGTQKGLVALVMADGSVHWSAGAEPVAGGLIRDDDYVAWSTVSGRAKVVTWAGESVMEIDGGVAGVAPMLLGGRALCVIDGDFRSVDLAASATDPKAGATLWYRAKWLGPITAGPVLADSHVYYGTARKGLVCVRPK